MNKINAKLILGICVCFILFMASVVKAEEGLTIVNQLSNELQQQGTVTSDEAKALEPSIREMIEKGESRQEIKNVIAQAVTQAHAQGLRGKDLAAKVHAAIQERKMQRTEAKTAAKNKSSKMDGATKGKSSGKNNKGKR
ncbi:MAG: hypothetical protein KKD05_03385 [Candidatus Omnitrophica bacterium]|nr:hypothetical protein [Candidatus Omnitrophota bacterium]